MAYVIHPNGQERIVTPEGPDGKMDYDQIRKEVDCDLVQCIELDGGRTMWLDEEGKFNPHLEANPKATELLRETGGIPGDFVLGRALICGPAEVE